MTKLVKSGLPIANKHLSLTGRGNFRYRLKTPHRDGITQVIFEPPDSIARLAALVSKPRVNLTRFHEGFALYGARVTSEGKPPKA